MRFRARLVLGLYGVALAVPAVVMAGPLGDDESTPGAMEMSPPQAQAPPHHHKGLFGRRHCVECQRAYAKAHDGVDVPAPPPLEPGIQGAVIRNGVPCPTCQGNMVVSGPMIVSGPAMTQDPHAPGYAVVGGPDAPGYAVVGEALAGSEPVPVGISKMRTQGAIDPRMAAMAGRPGAAPVDPSVVPTNLPAAQSPVVSPPSNRPHIISHLFGLPMLGQYRREREQQERDKHASIAYDQNQKPVTDLPASVVYGKGSH
jgi:hypothetical protein